MVMQSGNRLPSPRTVTRMGFSGRRIASTKTGVLGQTAGVLLTPNGVTGATYRVRGDVPRMTFNPSLIFANWYINGANGETDGPSDIVVKAALEYNGAFYPCTFAGRTNTTINPGCQIVSDPIGLLLPAGAVVYYRTYVSVAGGGQWPVSRRAVTALGEGANANVSGGSSGADLAFGAGAMAGNMLQNLYHPLAMVGDTGGARAIGYLADSIGVGANDSSTSDGAYSGPFERAFAGQIAWVSNGRSSAMVTDFLGRHRNRMAHFPQYISSVVNELGSNDLYSGAATSLEAMQSLLRGLWRQFLLRRLPVWQTTITPRATSSNGYADAAGQTIISPTVNALRVQVNDWLQASWRNEGLAGLIDFADSVESGRNSGLWRTDLGVLCHSDGIHPIAAGNQRLADTIPVSAMR